MQFTVAAMSAPQIREFHTECVPALRSKYMYVYIYIVKCLDDQSARWPFQRHMPNAKIETRVLDFALAIIAKI